MALAHPEMERFCIAFSKVPEKLVKEVGEDTFLKDLFQHYLQVWKGVSEATLRIMLCDLLLWRFLVSGPECNLHLESEFPLKPLLTTIDIRFTDIVGVHSRSNTPFLFVKVGKETVPKNVLGKNFIDFGCSEPRKCVVMIPGINGKDWSASWTCTFYMMHFNLCKWSRIIF